MKLTVQQCKEQRFGKGSIDEKIVKKDLRRRDFRTRACQCQGLHLHPVLGHFQLLTCASMARTDAGPMLFQQIGRFKSVEVLLLLCRQHRASFPTALYVRTFDAYGGELTSLSYSSVTVV